MSRVRRYSRSGPTAGHLRSPTGLSPPAVTRSSGLRLKARRAARPQPPPRPLAATTENVAIARSTAMIGVAVIPSKIATVGVVFHPEGDALVAHRKAGGSENLPQAFGQIEAGPLDEERPTPTGTPL